ncbi:MULTISPECIES: phosphate ABC transporter permease subunit PstC [unclassified Yoonia]|uniref:phosphate ABC transporter permease subunit PstC n=1 Tax=unclassified Yoonia TaxID=2629118 RepID=UPI002AFECDD2|nr:MULTISPECIES: phosphate ABC transporter permease subunit PstC [unclassified Yoonia]
MSAYLNFPIVLLVIIALAIAGYFLARRRASAIAPRLLHSRPHQHGWHVVFATAAPALIFVMFWVFATGVASNICVNSIVADGLADVQVPLQQRENLTEAKLEVREGVLRTQFVPGVRNLAVAINRYVANGNATEADVRSWNADTTSVQQLLSADGQVVGTALTPGMLRVALDLRQFNQRVAVIGPVLALILTVVGFALSLRAVSADFRARTVVERWVVGFLIFASTMAILTTVAILSAITLPSLTFFREYGFFNFLFGTAWAPAGDVVGIPEGRDGGYQSALGFVPLIWGTLYISVVALLVAVPLGLLAAVYLSEFASKWTRAWVKPALEILAGVPTIVYGIFALITIGPFLQAVVGATVMPNTVSVMTAGVVMGMMLVPFISSLSDDVINAVPQAMRDESLGLGATQAETVTKVILPAALPGIVGAIVLAASRAIGETMIVVLATGALSNVQGIEPNPFGAVVTVTTRIVAVLTGEGSGFDSIDVLAVFALAFTLFFITLALNLLAQRLVAKYREQYD